MAAKEFKLTAERLAELEQELNWLKTVREKEVAELIKEARSFGDLSENSEYDEAKNEQSKLYGRIAEVENILAHAVVITDSEVASDTVGLGCTITVKDLELEEEERYEIVGSQEADPARAHLRRLPVWPRSDWTQGRRCGGSGSAGRHDQVPTDCSGAIKERRKYQWQKKRRRSSRI